LSEKKKGKGSKAINKIAKTKTDAEKGAAISNEEENKENIANKRKKMPTILSNVKCSKN